jgi:hypothetical protein
VGDDGTVYVRTADGERSVGQFAEGTPEEALKFFTDRFDALAFEVELLEQRIKTGALSPDEAGESVKTVRGQVVDAHAVGDLDALVARLDGLTTVIDAQREERKAERAQKVAESKLRKEGIVTEAEKLATSNDWRNGATCSRSGRACRASTGPPTTPCGAASRPLAPPTPAVASRTSPSSTRSATRPGSSRSAWPPRPRSSPTPPTGARPPGGTAT